MDEKLDVGKILGRIPARLTGEIGAEARAHLRAEAGFDYEAFRAELIENLQKPTPMGPTLDCLTIEELGHSVDPTGFGFLDLRDLRIRRHVTACDDCAENVRLYRELERDSWIRGIEAEIETPVHGWLDAEAQRFPSNCIQFVAHVSAGTRGAAAGGLLTLSGAELVVGQEPTRYACKVETVRCDADGLVVRAWAEGVQGIESIDFIGLEGTVEPLDELLRTSGLVRIVENM